jgi:hypothetical protein
MGAVTQFPSFDERWRQGIDASIGEALRQNGYGAEVVAWILTEYERRLWACYPMQELPAFDLVVPSGTESKAVERVIRRMERERERTNELLLNLGAQLLLAVLELSAMQFSASATEKMKAKIIELIPRGSGASESLTR